MSIQLVRFSALIARDEFQSGSLSDQAQIDLKAYFVAVKQRYESGEQFPYNLEELVPTVFATKQKAVEALEKDFTQGIDFIRSTARLNGNPKPREDYFLSPLTFEFMVARRNKDVFSIYHHVFHVATPPSTGSSATDLAIAKSLESVAMFAAATREELKSLADTTREELKSLADTTFENTDKVEALTEVVSRQSMEITQLRIMTQPRRRLTASNDRQFGLALDPLAKPRGESKGGTHASPHEHYRRGHFRQLADGRVVEVKGHMVNQNKKEETLQ